MGKRKTPCLILDENGNMVITRNKRLKLKKGWTLLTKYDPCEILKTIGSGCEIKFTDTGFIRDCDAYELRHDTVADYLYPTYHGKGFMGEDFAEIKQNHDVTFINKKWSGLIHKCYNPKNKEYYKYGDKGYTVCDRWLDFCKFYHDYKKMAKSNGYNVDETTIIISDDEKVFKEKNTSVILTDNLTSIKTKNFIAVSPEGTEQLVEIPIIRFAKENDITSTLISRCLLGKIKSTKGWQFRYA